MSRIRSIHPGQWTDEDFVECSVFARLLVLGIRNEADDNGVFEWRATRLKMRLFPVDAIDVGALLGELESRRLVLRFEVEGRHYGAIRNFRVYQNPRSPKAEHPISAEAERFVGDRAGEDAAPKRGPGRPRKQLDAEKAGAQDKLIQQNVENNSEREKERREEENSPSDSSISEPIDLRSQSLVLIPSLPQADDVRSAFDAYAALRRGLVPGARALNLDPDRRRKLNACLRSVGGVQGWEAVLARIRGSPFLRGDRSDKGFVAEIDWLLKPANFRKVLEGNYDDNRQSPGGGGSHRRPGVPASPVDAFSVAIAASGLG